MTYRPACVTVVSTKLASIRAGTYQRCRAQTQGRSPVTWFSVALLLSPVLGFVAVILSAPRRPR